MNALDNKIDKGLKRDVNYLESHEGRLQLLESQLANTDLFARVGVPAPTKEDVKAFTRYFAIPDELKEAEEQQKSILKQLEQKRKELREGASGLIQSESQKLEKSYKSLTAKAEKSLKQIADRIDALNNERESAGEIVSRTQEDTIDASRKNIRSLIRELRDLSNDPEFAKLHADRLNLAKQRLLEAAEVLRSVEKTNIYLALRESILRIDRGLGGWKAEDLNSIAAVLQDSQPHLSRLPQIQELLPVTSEKLRGSQVSFQHAIIGAIEELIAKHTIRIRTESDPTTIDEKIAPIDWVALLNLKSSKPISSSAVREQMRPLFSALQEQNFTGNSSAGSRAGELRQLLEGVSKRLVDPLAVANFEERIEFAQRLKAEEKERLETETKEKEKISGENKRGKEAERIAPHKPLGLFATLRGMYLGFDKHFSNYYEESQVTKSAKNSIKLITALNFGMFGSTVAGLAVAGLAVGVPASGLFSISLICLGWVSLQQYLAVKSINSKAFGKIETLMNTLVTAPYRIASQRGAIDPKEVVRTTKNAVKQAFEWIGIEKEGGQRVFDYIDQQSTLKNEELLKLNANFNELIDKLGSKAKDLRAVLFREEKDGKLNEKDGISQYYTKEVFERFNGPRFSLLMQSLNAEADSGTIPATKDELNAAVQKFKSQFEAYLAFVDRANEKIKQFIKEDLIIDKETYKGDWLYHYARQSDFLYRGRAHSAIVGLDRKTLEARVHPYFDLQLIARQLAEGLVNIMDIANSYTGVDINAQANVRNNIAGEMKEMPINSYKPIGEDFTVPGLATLIAQRKYYMMMLAADKPVKAFVIERLRKLGFYNFDESEQDAALPVEDRFI